jgi:uncharacterized protein
MNDVELQGIRSDAESVFRCGGDSCHGFGHWRNVEANFLLIAETNGADILVGRLFAILHDCCREDDGADPLHGPRAAALIREWSPRLRLSTPQEDLLVFAVHHHTDGETTRDPTIGACWDADRLDLGRVGMIPLPLYMSTSVGREIARLGSRYLYLEQKRQQ